VLASLVNLKNLNLQGNPVAEKGKLAKKVIVFVISQAAHLPLSPF